MKQQTETTRQQKVASLIQQDMAEIFQRDASHAVSGALVSITKVRVSPDLSLAKIYLSVFPFEKHEAILKNVKAISSKLRFELGKRTKNQLRIIPELAFYNDDSMEYVQHIEGLISK